MHSMVPGSLVCVLQAPRVSPGQCIGLPAIGQVSEELFRRFSYLIPPKALELDLNSVERVDEYLNLPQEPPAISLSYRPPAYWPSSSSQSLLTVDNIEVKYAPDLPSILRGVSFNLKGGERAALLGRTGSGKSTLAMSILRFVDPVSGRILIDGIDITGIGIQDVRSKITFIPQGKVYPSSTPRCLNSIPDSPLFSGTIRDNLDPFSEAFT